MSQDRVFMALLNLAILGSGNGSLLPPVHNAIISGVLQANISMVISNKPQSGILQKARDLNLIHFALPGKGLSRRKYDEKLHEQLNMYQTDLVLLLGFMRILSADFVNKWENKILNIHPSLLPKHAGLMDLAVHSSVIESKDKTSGCTVHYVTSQVDSGKTILQKSCEVTATDTALSLRRKVQALEKKAIVAAISGFCV